MQRLPLVELIAEVEQKMTETKYSHDTLNSYRRRWRDLLEFTAETGTEYFTVDFGDSYLKEKCGIDLLQNQRPKDMPAWKVKEFKRVIYVLADYQNNQVIMRKKRMGRIIMPACFEDMTSHFQSYCYQRYNAQSTIYQKRWW